MTTDEEEVVRKGPQPFPPRFIKALLSGQVYDEETLILEAEVDAFPFPEFSWYLGDQQLLPSDLVKIQSSKNRSILTVRNPKAGIYTVRAKNEFGAATSSACIKVKSKMFT